MRLNHMIFSKQIFPTISVLLRKRNIGFFLFVKPVVKEVSCDSDKSGKNMSSEVGTAQNGSPSKRDKVDSLTLYYHQYSFYSQKVVMALHEKQLPFKHHTVDIMKGEQYDPWFLKINPRGEVPVLKDGDKIIVDSSKIVDYLEDKYSEADIPSLLPSEEGPEMRANVVYFRTIIEQIPIGVVTMGSFFHPELVEGPKIPFIGPIRMMMAKAEKNSSKNLREYASKNIDAKVVLTEKADFQDKKHQLVINKQEYLELLDQVEEVLVKVEDQLTKHQDKEDFWLIADQFTIVDISLTIFLERLDQLGYSTRFWKNGKRPNIEKYHEKVKQRDSYKKTIPNKFFLVKMIIQSNAPVLLGVSVAAAAAFVLGSLFGKKLF